MFKPAKPEHIERARRLRRVMTPQERKLWRELRILRSRGLHFRRQAPFRGYYLDFVEHKARLVVEVDGGQHYEAAHRAHDNVRDRVLAREGYRTLRIESGSIDKSLEFVMELIWAHLVEHRPHPEPFALRPPHKGGGEMDT